MLVHECLVGAPFARLVQRGPLHPLEGGVGMAGCHTLLICEHL